jgi:hypothetical protein
MLLHLLSVVSTNLLALPSYVALTLMATGMLLLIDFCQVIFENLGGLWLTLLSELQFIMLAPMVGRSFLEMMSGSCTTTTTQFRKHRLNRR